MTRTRTGTSMTEVTTIALCTSCSQAVDHAILVYRDVLALQMKRKSIDLYILNTKNLAPPKLFLKYQKQMNSSTFISYHYFS